MSDVSGKVAIVTGAGRGIGRGIALAYASAGIKVAVASRTKSTVDAVTKEIADTGGTAIGITCDVGHKDQIQAMVASTVKAFGTVDILVNNAQGFGTEQKPAPTPVLTPLEDFEDGQVFLRCFRLPTFLVHLALNIFFNQFADAHCIGLR